MPRDEVFQNYAPHLTAEVWPTSDGELLYVDDMPPQHAAAALAKLVRWATNHPQGTVTLLQEAGLREEHVRRSPLGQALAARAQNLDIHSAHALYMGEPAAPDSVRHEIASAIAELVPGTAGLGANAVAEVVYGKLSRRFTITAA